MTKKMVENACIERSEHKKVFHTTPTPCWICNLYKWKKGGTFRWWGKRWPFFLHKTSQQLWLFFIWDVFPWAHWILFHTDAHRGANSNSATHTNSHRLTQIFITNEIETQELWFSDWMKINHHWNIRTYVHTSLTWTTTKNFCHAPATIKVNILGGRLNETPGWGELVPRGIFRLGKLLPHRSIFEG